MKETFTASAIVNGVETTYEVPFSTRTEETVVAGVRYLVTHTVDATGFHTTMTPIGSVPIPEHRVVNMTTGRTSCCGSFSTIGQDDGVEYCKACGNDITGYTADDIDDLTQPTRFVIGLDQ